MAQRLIGSTHQAQANQPHRGAEPAGTSLGEVRGALERLPVCAQEYLALGGGPETPRGHGCEWIMRAGRHQSGDHLASRKVQNQIGHLAEVLLRPGHDFLADQSSRSADQPKPHGIEGAGWVALEPVRGGVGRRLAFGERGGRGARRGLRLARAPREEKGSEADGG